MSWHQTRPVLVELVSPAVICFSLMKWYFEPHGTVKGWRGEEGMLCCVSPPFPPLVSPTHAFFLSLSLSLPLHMHLMRLHQSPVAASVTCHTRCGAWEQKKPAVRDNKKKKRKPLHSARVIRYLREAFLLFVLRKMKKRKETYHDVRLPSSGVPFNLQLLSVFLFFSEVFNIWGASLNCK